jgi:hypothetical protein
VEQGGGIDEVVIACIVCALAAPAKADGEPEFLPLCPKEVRDKYDMVWAELLSR